MPKSLVSDVEMVAMLNDSGRWRRHRGMCWLLSCVPATGKRDAGGLLWEIPDGIIASTPDPGSCRGGVRVLSLSGMHMVILPNQHRIG
jgi:hypothetical protein